MPRVRTIATTSGASIPSSAATNAYAIANGWQRLPRLALLACLTCSPLPAWNAVRAADESKPVEVQSIVLKAQQARVSAMQQAAAATIAIFGLDGGGGGSGVLISPDGYALTNYHVSSACGNHMRCGLNDGQVYDAVIVGIDATGDVSLIKLLGRDDFPTAPLADSDQVQVGQWCFAAGNPFVLATNLQPSISMGIVSGVNRYQYPAGTLLEYADCIQTDAAINPGNSGGPLFNMNAEVIGINGRCSFEKRGRVNVGVGYAISANQIKHFLGMLKSGRLVDHATLGATVATDDSGSVRVSNILSGCDAYRRGLRYGDEIVGLADREVRTANHFKNILGTLPKDWRVPLTIRRQGKSQTLLVRLEGVHTEKQLTDLVNAETAQAKEAPHPPHGPQPPSQEEQPKDRPADSPEELSPEESGVDPSSQEMADAPVEPGQPDKRLVASKFIERPGFANYHFNQQRRLEIWDGLNSNADYTSTPERWKLIGKVAGETTPITIELEKAQGILSIGSRAIRTELTDRMSQIVAQRRETGVASCLACLEAAMATWAGTDWRHHLLGLNAGLREPHLFACRNAPT
jgi:serine protease Do